MTPTPEQQAKDFMESLLGEVAFEQWNKEKLAELTAIIRERDELKTNIITIQKLAKELAEALNCADNSYFGSGTGQLVIDTAKSNYKNAPREVRGE